MFSLAATAWNDASINVFAAASLKDAFTEIARSYEASHSGTKVKLSFAGSQTLAAQINYGAPADVFASADLDNLIAIKPVGSVKVFARNILAIVVPKRGSSVTSPQQLIKAQRIVLADIKVPAGKYAALFLKAAGAKFGGPWLAQVEKRIVSREVDVRTVLARVRLGEADAGIVYVTDAKSAGSEVRTIVIPEALNVVADYPVGIPKKAANAEGGRAFMDYLMGKAAQQILRRKGFLLPPKSK